MANPTETFMDINNNSKVQNQKRSKSQIVLINHTGRMRLLVLPPKQNGRPVAYITGLMFIFPPYNDFSFQQYLHVHVPLVYKW